MTDWFYTITGFGILTSAAGILGTVFSFLIEDAFDRDCHDLYAGATCMFIVGMLTLFFCMGVALMYGGPSVWV